MLSDSISARTIALLFLYNSYIYCADGKFCITTMHMNYSLFTLRSSLNLSYPPEHYSCCFSIVSPQCIWIIHSSLFVLHLICHIRHNIILAVSLQQFHTKFCITTKYFIIGLHRTSLPNFHFSILNSHFSIFNYPPFYPPRNTIAKSAETSKKCWNVKNKTAKTTKICDFDN